MNLTSPVTVQLPIPVLAYNIADPTFRNDQSTEAAAFEKSERVLKQQAVNEFETVAFGSGAMECHEFDTTSELVFRLEGKALRNVLAKLGDFSITELIKGVPFMKGLLTLDLEECLDCWSEDNDWDASQRAAVRQQLLKA